MNLIKQMKKVEEEYLDNPAATLFKMTQVTGLSEKMHCKEEKFGQK